MNKKGFTFIEVILTMAITLSITYGVVIFPAKIMQEYNEYNELVVETSDINLIRTALTKDLSGAQAEIVDAKTLKVGKGLYKFTDKGLKRDDGVSVVDLSSEVYSFQITGNMLHVYNDTVSIKYSLSTSLNRGELK